MPNQSSVSFQAAREALSLYDIAARIADLVNSYIDQVIEGLKQLGAIFVGRLPAPKETVARTALDNLKITTQGNELQIRTAVAQATLGPLMRGL